MVKTASGCKRVQYRIARSHHNELKLTFGAYLDKNMKPLATSYSKLNHVPSLPLSLEMVLLVTMILDTSVKFNFFSDCFLLI